MVFLWSGALSEANQSATVATGSSVTFSVTVDGTAPFTYQWRKDGANITSATSSTFTIVGAQATSNGNYTVQVSNSAGSTNSDIGTLTVSNPAFTTQPLSQTVATGANVTFTATANGSATPTYQWQFNGVDIAGATSASLTLTNVDLSDMGTYTVVATIASSATTSNGAVLTVQVGAILPAITTQPVGQTVTTGANVNLTAAASGSPVPTFQWRKNGANISGATNATLALSNVQLTDAGTYSVVASNTVGSATSSGAILTVNSASSAPVITTQPSNRTVTAGTSATFTAAASGSPTPTYQWRKNGVNVSGATSATLTIPNAQSTNAGTYTLVATNSLGSATSNAVTLTVNPAGTIPVITTQPLGQTVTIGSTVSLTVAATGSPTPTYQWRKNGTNISGATSANLPFSNIQASSAGTYTVVATNSAGSATSTGAVLNVVAPTIPVITTQPFNGTVAPGATATFTAAATGLPAPTYQWQKNGVNVPGATSGTLTLPNVTVASAGTYTLFASNSAGTTASNGAVLTVQAAPVFAGPPTISPSGPVTAGDLVTFTAAASGTPAPSYQWQKDGVDIAGETGSSYFIPSVSVGHAGSYRVVATNAAGSAPSTAVTLMVNPATPVITWPTPAAIDYGTVLSGAQLNATADVAGSFVYNPSSGTLLNAAAGQILSVTFTPTDTANYTVATASTTLTVNKAPAVITWPAPATITYGTTLGGTQLNATANISGSFVYSPAAGAVINAGIQTLGVTFTPTDSTNYATTIGATTITVNKATPVITWAPPATIIFPAPLGGAQLNATANAPGSFVYSPAAGAVLPAGVQSLSVTFTPADTANYNSASASNSITVNSAPTITAQPPSHSVTVGANVTLSVTASGFPAPTFQWRRAGVDIPGATADTYTITNAQLSDNVIYTVVATNSFGSATSNDAVLTVVTAPITPVRGDFNNDGQPDILWRDTSTGAVYFWFMNGTVYQSTLALGVAPVDWGIYGVGDFNNDGQTDILWRNSTTGTIAYWLMNGTMRQSVVVTANVPTEWIISGTGDFNADGKVDILWRKPSIGDVAFWLMNGTALQSVLVTANVPTDWTIAGTADYNGDGQVDILWQRPSSGAVAIWLMNGTALQSVVVVGNTLPLGAVIGN